MKHKLNFLSVVIVFTILFFGSCKFSHEKTSQTSNNSEDEKKAEEVVEVFFEAYNNKEFEEHGNLFYSTFKEEIVNLLEGKFDVLGEVVSFEKYNLKNTSYEGEKAIDLYYKIKYKKEEYYSYVNIALTKEDNKLKIVFFNQGKHKNLIDDFDNALKKAEQTAEELHGYLKNNEINEINKLLDKRFIEAELEEKFMRLFQSNQQYYNNTTCLLLNSSDKTVNDTEQVFILTYKCETENKEIFYEELILILNKDTYEIIGYNLADSVEGL